MSSNTDKPLRLTAGTEPRRMRHAATLALLGLFLLPLPGWLSPGDGTHAQLGREAIFWLMAVALLGWVHFVDRRPLRSVGLRRPGRTTIASGVGASIVMIAGMTCIYLFVFPAIGETEAIARLEAMRALPLGLRAGMVLRAAIFEELFYRGFAIERLTEITGSRWAAALASLAAFTIGHLAGWGPGHLLVAGFGGAVLTALYLWRRDLAANCLAHFLTDAIGLLLG